MNLAKNTRAFLVEDCTGAGEQPDDITREIASSSQRCPLMLDDAVSVVCSLVHTTSERDQTLTMAQVETMVNECVQKALFSMQARGNSPPRQQKNSGPSASRHASSQSKKAKSKISKSTRTRRGSEKKDAVQVCCDCGGADHIRGDDDCPFPSFLTKKIKRDKAENGQQMLQGGPSTGSAFFRPGPSNMRN